MHRRLTVLLASHFHDEILRHATLSGLAVLGGTLALVAVLALLRWTALRTEALPGESIWRPNQRTGRERWPVVPRGLAVVAVAIIARGAFGIAEAGAMRHNHLCHAHSSDTCSSEPDKYHADTHTHWFGSRTALHESEMLGRR